MVSPGPRGVQWRADAPATLVWAEAMDGGNARREAAVRDRVLMLDAPFTGQPRTLIDLPQRYAGIHWGRDDLALVTRAGRPTRGRAPTWSTRPRPARGAPALGPLSEDRYGDPGSPRHHQRERATGASLLARRRAHLPDGRGREPARQLPFLDRLTWRTARRSGSGRRRTRTTRWWSRCSTTTAPLPHAPRVGDGGAELFVRDLRTGAARALTRFADPAPQLAGVQRQLITYPRADGVMLSRHALHAAGLRPARDGPLPTLLWAYPREFRDADAASQVTDSPNRFSRPAAARTSSC
jgi:dipeptidyl aminopeptidase/acylaminoacyl peptidase